MVPQLTRSPDIKLNVRISLRRRKDRIRLSHPTISAKFGPTVAKPLGYHIRCAALFLRKTMTIRKTSQVAQISDPPPQFSIVCKICDGLGIVFDCAEQAPSSTQIKCRHCGAPRGTLGDLRNLSNSDRQDLFEI
jgi:hypothetical protein